jgi:hypothetical protein
VQGANKDHLNKNTQGLLKAIKTSWKTMWHTDEASKYAKRCCFAMLDYYRLNSLFLTTTPDNECSFRVRLYAKHCAWGSAFCDNIFYFGKIILISAMLNKITFFEVTRNYKKVFKPLQRDSEDKYKFSYTHPGHKFSHLKRSKHPTTILNVYLINYTST